MSTSVLNPIDIYFVVMPEAMLLDLASVAEPFGLAKRLGANLRLHFVGPELTPHTFLGLQLAGVGPLPQELPVGSVVVMPELASVPDGTRNHHLIRTTEWLQRVVEPSSSVRTVRSGSFHARAPAQAQGRACVKLQPSIGRNCYEHHRVVVHQEGVSVVGASTRRMPRARRGTDFALRLLSALAGPMITLEVARHFAGHPGPIEAGSPNATWLLHRDHVNSRLHQVQDLILRNPTHDWSVPDLAERIYTSPRNLTRLFKTHAGVPPLTYIRKVRTSTAKELLARPGLSVGRIAEMSGFKSTEQMRRSWRKFEGALPMTKLSKRGLARNEGASWLAAT